MRPQIHPRRRLIAQVDARLMQTRKLNRNVHQVHPVYHLPTIILVRMEVSSWRGRVGVGGWTASPRGCNPWIMARSVTLASLTLVFSLKLRSEVSWYRKNDPKCKKDASLLRRTVLHHRRAAAMADDERTTLSHRIREREVNLSCERSGVAHKQELGSVSFFIRFCQQ